MSIPQNNAPFFKRFYQYQKERFPILAHGVLISVFTFSAISFSRICRGEDGFIPFPDFLIGIFATITLFLLVRIFDEFKDQEDDRLYRPYLPVPRGLISLKELKIIAIFVSVLQVGVIAYYQTSMLYLYLIVLGYLCLMGVEFFVPKWLKQHHILYITSHMVIIPLIDIYSSGLDWLLADASPHWGLAWFFSVSYMNGLVLEFGRKLRIPETEENGVLSYTVFFGPKKGVYVWIITMLSTLFLAIGAAQYAQLGILSWVILIISFLICVAPGVSFLFMPTSKKNKYMEYTSGIWTILMYLTLGGIPMLKSLLLCI